jgi:hypothetical protein
MLSELIKFVKRNQEDVILVAGVVLISLLSFAAGYIIAEIRNKEPLQFEERSSGLTKPVLCDRIQHILGGRYE